MGREKEGFKGRNSRAMPRASPPSLSLQNIVPLCLFEDQMVFLS